MVEGFIGGGDYEVAVGVGIGLISAYRDRIFSPRFSTEFQKWNMLVFRGTVGLSHSYSVRVTVL